MERAANTEYDAVIVGSGPNGLAAAIALQQQSLRVLVVEAKDTIGGGMRTAELTLPGFKHDICSSVNALSAASPYLKTLPLEKFGLEYCYADIDAAHPLDDGSSAILARSIELTAASLGADRDVYIETFTHLTKVWPELSPDILGPLRFPKHPLEMARFGIPALTSALQFSRRFKTARAKALWGGVAAHSIQPLSNLSTSSVALVLMTVSHAAGWPVAKGGAQSLADAMSNYFLSLGGRIETGCEITSMREVPSGKVLLFDLTPRQLLRIAGEEFSSVYKSQLGRYRYGMGVFKVDWALDGPIPFTNADCRRAGTVHLGGTLEEIARHEQGIWHGETSANPFVLLVQPSVMDDTRAPAGKHTGWAYCHTPSGSQTDMTAIIENQVERFAPGFRDLILARHTMNNAELESYNANYIGGDINGGVIDLAQLFTRPALRLSPYRTSAKNIYICSSSTPPGGGVHGLCGFYAARRALRDHFGIKISL